MDIHVVCEACGTELETPDAKVDALFTVTIIARPCPKCNRPPDCHISCEDVLKLTKELEAFRESETQLDKEVMQLKREVAETEKDLIETKNLLLETKQKSGAPPMPPVKPPKKESDDDEHPRCLTCEFSYPSDACDNAQCDGSI